MFTNTMTSAQTTLLPPRTRRSSRSRSMRATIISAQLDQDDRHQQQEDLLGRERVHRASLAGRSPGGEHGPLRPGFRAPLHPSAPVGRPAAARLATRPAAPPPADRPRPGPRGVTPMTDDRERWALILGGSSGMGEATALALAAERLPDHRHPPRLPGRARPRRGGQGGDRGRRQRGPLRQHERRRRREAGRGDRDDPRPVRRRAARPAATRTSGSSCTRSRSGRSCRSSPTTPRRRSIARRWR